MTYRRDRRLENGALRLFSVVIVGALLWGCRGASDHAASGERGASPRVGAAPERAGAAASSRVSGAKVNEMPRVSAAEDTLPKGAPATTIALDYVATTTGAGSPDQSLPWVIALHGLGDRPESFASLFAGVPFAAHVYIPRAPRSRGSGTTGSESASATSRMCCPRR